MKIFLILHNKIYQKGWQKRAETYALLKQNYDDGKSAFFLYDKIKVDGESYINDPVEKKPVLERKQRCGKDPRFTIVNSDIF